MLEEAFKKIKKSRFPKISELFIFNNLLYSDYNCQFRLVSGPNREKIAIVEMVEIVNDLQTTSLNNIFKPDLTTTSE